MRIIRYIGNDAICKAFSKQTGITWTTGMTSTVLDDKVAAEMLKHPTVFEDASNASDPVSAQAAAIAAVSEAVAKSVTQSTGFDEPVLFVGDSIAAALWPKDTPATAAEAAVSGRWIVAQNTGSGGERSAQILARLQREMTFYGAKSAVIVACTWNDIGQLVPLADSVANVLAMIEVVKAAGGVPFVCSPTPDGTTGSTLARRQAADNRYWAFRELCYQSGARFIDIRSVLTDPATGLLKAAFNADGSVHPNAAGYAAIGAKIALELNAAFPGNRVLDALDVMDQKDLLGGAGLFSATTTVGADTYGSGWSYSDATGATASVTSGVQQIACSGLSGSAYMDKALTGWAAGDLIEVRGLLYNSGGTMVPRVRLVIGGSPVPNTYPAIESATARALTPFTLRWRVSTGSTSINLRVQAQGGADGTVQVSKLVARNLTALGID